MSTLKERYENSDKNINPTILDRTPFSDDDSLQIDNSGLYFSSNEYKYGTNYSKIKSDKQTFVEQEISGIRVRSAVELNNPLIYGNEAIRIVNRTTSTVEDMKSATGGEGGDGGLVGQGLSKLTGGKVSSISQARDAVNSKLGIPSNPIPSRLIGDIGGLPSTEPITKDNVGEGLQGTGLGNFLKDTGGGNPKTLGKQALGKGIGLAKDKLRGALFGQEQSIGDAIGDDNGLRINYNNENTYSRFNREERNIFTEGGIIEENDTPIPFGNQSIDRIDLKKVSPIYGLDRKATDGRFGNSEYAFQDKDYPNGGNNVDSPAEGDNFSAREEHELETLRGLTSSNGDRINIMGVPNSSGTYTDGVDQATKKELEESQLIPFWVSGLDSSTPVFFRTLLTGLNETVSPSWSGNKFVGNPYNYYTYSGVERSTSFNLKLYCMNQAELVKNWERITYLTSKAYPSIKSNLVYPPFIKFRLGDIYNNKIGFIESLQYTMPDNGVWETEIDGSLLPKFIEVALTIKFVEQPGSEYSLYSYHKSKDAISETKNKLSEGDTSVSTEPVSNGSNTQNNPPIIDKNTGQILDENDSVGPEKEKSKSGVKNLNSGKKEPTPNQKNVALADSTIRATLDSNVTIEYSKAYEKLKQKITDDDAAKKLAKRYSSSGSGLQLIEVRKEDDTKYYIKEFVQKSGKEREYLFKKEFRFGSSYPRGFTFVWSFNSWKEYEKQKNADKLLKDISGGLF